MRDFNFKKIISDTLDKIELKTTIRKFRNMRDEMEILTRKNEDVTAEEYLVTILVLEEECKMLLNEVGQLLEKCNKELSISYNEVYIDALSLVDRLYKYRRRAELKVESEITA